MSLLKPGATYVYENDGNKIYARESGSNVRILIGETDVFKSMKETQLWHEIRKAAETNPTLQKELDRVKILYYLSIKHGA